MIEDKELEFVNSVTNYLKNKDLEKQAKNEVAYYNSEIKGLLSEVDTTEVDGHLNKHIILADGQTQVHVQLQRKSSVSTVPNVLQEVINKIGIEKAAKYIVVTETLHENALEQMFNNKELTEDDLKELTIEKVSEALVIKQKK